MVNPIPSSRVDFQSFSLSRSFGLPEDLADTLFRKPMFVRKLADSQSALLAADDVLVPLNVLEGLVSPSGDGWYPEQTSFKVLLDLVEEPVREDFAGVCVPDQLLGMPLHEGLHWSFAPRRFGKSKAARCFSVSLKTMGVQ